MSLAWVKLHTSLLDNETFQRFTPAAKLTFLTALMIAGKQDLNGRLEAPPFGAIKPKDIASKTGCRMRLQDEALSELVTARFLSVDLHGVYIVERWEEKAGDKSRLETQRERQRRCRQRKKSSGGDVTVTRDKVTDKEKEEENYASLRSAAIGYGDWPRESPYLNALALLFLDRFANTREVEAAAKQLGAYTSALAAMRQRGVTIEQAWDACEQCWIAGREEPLFQGKIRRALDYLPSWSDRRQAARSRFKNDRSDEELAAALDAKERRDMAS